MPPIFSQYTQLTDIPENSAGTPGLWNSRYSVIWQDFSQLQSDVSNLISAGTYFSSNSWYPESGQTVNVFASGMSAVVSTPSQPFVTTAANLTTIGKLVAGAVPASLVTAGTFGAGDYVFPANLTVTSGLVATVAKFAQTNDTTGVNTVLILQNPSVAAAAQTVNQILSFSDTSGNAVTGARFIGLKTGTWTSTVSTQSLDYELALRRAGTLTRVAKFYGSGNVRIGSTDGDPAVAVGWLGVEGGIGPMSDNAVDSGRSATRWRTGYFGTSVIVKDDASAASSLLLNSANELRTGTTDAGFFGVRTNNSTATLGSLTGAPTLQLRRLNGTWAALTKTVSGNNTGAIVFQGYDGTSDITNAQILSGATEDFGTTFGSNFLIQTVLTGGSTLANALVIQGDRAVRAGSDNAQSLGTSATRWSTVFGYTGDFATQMKSPIVDSGAATDLLLKRNAVTQLTLGSLAATFAGSITTSAPSGGAAAAWKLGRKQAATVALDTANYVELDIGGVAIKLGIVA